MSDDAGRVRPTTGPAHGSVDPIDPVQPLDPIGRDGDPGLRGTGTGGAEVAVPPPAPSRQEPVKHSKTSGLWVGLILSALVLLFLLIFILQNGRPVNIQFLGLDGTLPTGVALLLAAIAGLLLVAIPGTIRILQLRRAAKRAGRGR